MRVSELRALSAYDCLQTIWAYRSSCGAAPKDEIDSRVQRCRRYSSLGPYLERFPRQLSAASAARCHGPRLVRPSQCVVREPLSKLEPNARRDAYTKSRKCISGKTTTVYVTHDRSKAMTMADKIVVMHDGIVEQSAHRLISMDKPEQSMRRRFPARSDELPEG